MLVCLFISLGYLVVWFVCLFVRLVAWWAGGQLLILASCLRWMHYRRLWLSMIPSHELQICCVKLMQNDKKNINISYYRQSFKKTKNVRIPYFFKYFTNKVDFLIANCFNVLINLNMVNCHKIVFHFQQQNKSNIYKSI